jgi:hypothetical protein
MFERRREPRVYTSWPLQVAGISGCGDGEVIDIRLCGVQFAAGIELDEGELVLLRIRPDAGTTVDCVAQIVRRYDRGGGKVYGADFRYLSAVDRQRLSFALLVLQEPSVTGRLGSTV